ncbi:MAG: hypothetical protein Q7R51_01150 [bacterium]|nr:hypothetical protein [bacterium]
MRYNQSIKDKVRYLRSKGFSLGQISQETDIPRTTIRTWIKDIILSKKQTETLKERVQKNLQKGRIKFQKIQGYKRQRNEKILMENGINEIGQLSSRDFLIAGASLYWAEGFKNKHEHRLGFCNSDPLMIKFYIYWLEKCLGISKDQLIARLTLNYTYKDSAEKMQDFWTKIIGLSSSQFTKPFFQTSKWKKQYNTKNYHGVLRIHVKDSLNHLLKMKGWIEGLKMLK